VAKSLLSDAGMHVDIAGDGKQAVAMVGQHTYDLVLMDIQMPIMDGIDATRLIRQLPDKKELPILALTANVFEEYRQRCTDAGMNDFVGKPVEPMALFSTMLKWLPSSAGKEMKMLTPVYKTELSGTQYQADLYARLLEIEGLDINKGLPSVSGKIEKYWELLKDFVTLHQGDAVHLKQLIKTGPSEESVRLAHTLKGASATLGLSSIRSIASKLEENLKAPGIDVEPQANELAVALEVLQSAVSYIARDEVVDTVMPNQNEAINVLNELEQLLKLGDFKANQRFKENRALLRASVDKIQMGVLEEAMGNYDFPRGVETIQRIMADLPAHDQSK
jgi:CheY-like chemotaxis protein